jgi:hypothetical protein
MGKMRVFRTGAPAEVISADGSLSREAKNDIKKGMRWTSLMAFNALFEVSLQLIYNTTRIYDQGTHERHHSVVITLSENSYISFCVLPGEGFGDSRYWANVVEICGRDVVREPLERDRREYLWYKRFQWSENIFVIHFGADVIATIDT